VRYVNQQVFASRLSIKPFYSFAFSRDISSRVNFSTRPTQNINTGKLSYKSTTRIRNAMNWMLLFAQEKTVYSIKKKKAFKFRISFITLTLSTAQQHSDTYILHKLLFPFLKYLERKHEVTAYIWRAEIQGKRLKQRGERCIHFHITTDKFIHWRQIRNKWNALQCTEYRKHNRVHD